MAHPALILAAALVLQAPAGPFVSKEGGFRIGFPFPPEEKAQQVPSPIGPIATHFFQVAKGDVDYVVSYSDYPSQIAQSDPDQVLDGAANGALGGFQGSKLLKKQDRKIGQVPGKEFEFSYTDRGGADGLGRTRLYLSGTRMYSVSIAGPKAAVASSSDGFFRSFALDKTIASPATRPAAPASAISPTMPKGRPTTPGPIARDSARHMTGASGTGSAKPAAAKGRRRLRAVRLPKPAASASLCPPSPRSRRSSSRRHAGEVEVTAFVVQPQQDGRRLRDHRDEVSRPGPRQQGRPERPGGDGRQGRRRGPGCQGSTAWSRRRTSRPLGAPRARSSSSAR